MVIDVSICLSIVEFHGEFHEGDHGNLVVDDKGNLMVLTDTALKTVEYKTLLGYFTVNKAVMEYIT